MKPISATKSTLRGVFHYTGRTTRSEFWWYVLFTFPAFILFWYVAGKILVHVGPAFFELTGSVIVGFIVLLITILILLYSAAITRRMHDIGRSGWLALTFVILPPLFLLFTSLWMLFYPDAFLYVFWPVEATFQDVQVARSQYWPFGQSSAADRAGENLVEIAHNRGMTAYIWARTVVSLTSYALLVFFLTRPTNITRNYYDFRHMIKSRYRPS